MSEWTPIPDRPGWYTKPYGPPKNITPEIALALEKLQERFDEIDRECDEKKRQQYNPSVKSESSNK